LDNTLKVFVKWKDREKGGMERPIQKLYLAGTRTEA